MLRTIFISLLLAGCASNPKEGIEGKWLMHQVIQDGKDVTSEHDPYDERFMILNSDSTFESGGRPYGKNTGHYMFSSVDLTLFLDSDAGPDDDSQWKVSFKGDTMHWQGYGSDWALSFEILHLKEKDK